MSEKPKDDGGRAFPNDGAWANNHPEGGMSLRDWFAGRALAGSLAAGFVPAAPTDGARLAKAVYALADAMLIERAKS